MKGGFGELGVHVLCALSSSLCFRLVFNNVQNDFIKNIELGQYVSIKQQV